MAQAEVFQVNRMYLPYLWKDWVRILRREPLGRDLTGLRQRLLLGEEVAWIALSTTDRRCLALILTRVRAPVLSIHFAGGRRGIESWIESAIERLGGYARLCRCTELRILARKGWKEYVVRFEGFHKVSFSRDRPTRFGRGRQNKVGYYRGVLACSPPVSTTAAATS